MRFVLALSNHLAKLDSWKFVTLAVFDKGGQEKLESFPVDRNSEHENRIIKELFRDYVLT